MQSRETRDETRTATFAMLKEYGRNASTKEAGDEILSKNGYKSGDYHDTMVHDMKMMKQALHNNDNVELCQIAKKTGFTTDSIESVVSRHMQGTMSSDTRKWNYYPVYDLTHARNVWQKPLAIAAVDSRTWRLEDILRMDDPEAKVIYNDMRKEVSERLNIPMPGPQTNAKTTERNGQKAQRQHVSADRKPPAASDRKKSQLHVYYDPDHNTCSIASRYGVKTTGDPLSKKYINTTLDIIREMHEAHPGVDVTVESDCIIDISKNGRNNDVYACYMDQKGDVRENHKILTITPRTDPYKLFSVKTDRTFYQGNTTTSIKRTYDLAECAGRTINGDYVRDIQEDAAELTCMAARNPLGMDIMSMRDKAHADGLRPIPGPKRTIPESQKPDFMRDGDTPQDDVQYE